MILVDTGAWYASIVPADVNHRAARQWMDRNSLPLLTTDYIIDETLTLLRARGHAPLALELGARFFQRPITRIEFLSEADIQATWNVFRTYKDKQWSFTDCSSKVIIEKLGLSHAFSFDAHFRQFGAVIVVP